MKDNPLTRREFMVSMAAASAAVMASDLLTPPARAGKTLAASGLETPERGFISRLPAGTWEEALISGNGRMGAMVMSRVANEEIILSHERLFLPWHEPLPPVDTGSHLSEIRQMLAEGHYQRAADYVVELSKQEGYREKRWTDPFFPACDLRLDIAPNGDPTAYARTLDFATGVASVAWNDAQGQFVRRLFVSRPDNVVVLSIKGPGKGRLNAELRLAQREADGWWDAAGKIARGIKDHHATAEAGWLLYQSRYKLTDGGYACLARVTLKSGSMVADGERLTIKNADEALVVMRVVPLKHFADLNVAAEKESLERISGGFDAMLRRHSREHGRLFNRARLDLNGGAERSVLAETLVERSHQGVCPNALLEKYFDAGRYEIISSCGELPPNLQGVWTGTWGAPWSGDYTQNGNVQSAIASILSSNMPECMESYFRYMEELLPDGRTNAKRLYGARGNVVASRTSTHGLNNHFDATWPMTFWVAGAGWAAQFFYDYYLYTGDRTFLAKRAIPFMKEAALFYEDYLILDANGRYLFSPSYSPENNPGNSASQACINATMDIAVAKELLNNLIAACNEMGVEKDGVARWKAMLAKMPEYLLNKAGAVKEWATPGLEDNDAHRHCSHLYPLFNGLPADIANDPRLVRGFQLAIENRMVERRKEAGGGVMAFGLVQMGLVASSVGDRDTVSFVLDRLTRNYHYINLATSHDPDSIFNADASGGLPAVIIKSLVYSQPGMIQLLPALPAQLPSGRISGLLCRGQVTVVEMGWSQDRISLVLESRKRQEIAIKAPSAIKAFDVTRGSAVAASTDDDNTWRITLPAKQRIAMEIRLA